MTLTKLNNQSLPSGSVLQVVSASTSTYAQTTLSTYSDTGLSATITPTSSSSKVMILISAGMGNTTGTANNNTRILRGSTEVCSFSRVSHDAGDGNQGHESFTFLDSPSTTSATTYKLQFMTDTGAFRFCDFSGDTTTATITLMEIAG